MLRQLFRIENTRAPQVASDGFANIRSVLQPAWPLVWNARHWFTLGWTVGHRILDILLSQKPPRRPPL